MAAVSSDLNMIRVTNEEFVKKAEECTPKLYKTVIHPKAVVEIRKKERGCVEVRHKDIIKNLPRYALKKGDRLCLDFGNHQVGYVTLRLKSTGSPQDAPAFFKLKFGENAGEITENSDEYDGWISKGWIQEEYLHVDILPAELKLSRRYAFRYMELQVIDTSMKWQLVIEEVFCTSVTSAGDDKVKVLNTRDEEMQAIDRVSIRTLRNCMQQVFEDGPKRDRRLWLGDLRLQALTNYETYGNYDLVKRCLYLFAGQTKDNGQVSACLFTEPELCADDTFLLDYSMFFGTVLLDYYQASGDVGTLRELKGCAYKQMELAGEWFDERNLMKNGEGFWAFVDWTEGLNKQTSLQGIYLYCMKRVKKIAELLDEREKAEEFSEEIRKKTEAAKKYLLDPEKKIFVSGEDRQISYASQVWMILAEAVSGEEGAELLDRICALDPEKGMVSPYMNHHFAEALILCGRKQQALDYIRYYWGGMIREGADTFWELYNPRNPSETPYGSCMVNSYCHAWSCTPAYLFRKYFNM